jgi:replicative DNA helicase
MENNPNSPKAAGDSLDKAFEEAVIGALLCEWVKGWPKVNKFLTAASFQDHRNKILMGAMECLERNGLPVDLLTVLNQTRLGGTFRGELAHYATGCMSKVAGTGNLLYHAQLVVEHSMIAQAQIELRSAQAGINQSSDRFAALFLAQERIANIQIKPQSKAQSVSEIWTDSLAVSLEQNAIDAKNGKRTAGISTGFLALDRMLTGLQDGDLTVIAARPAMGKTAFMLSLAISAARQGVGVFIKSLEMPKDQLAMRLLAYLTGVNTIDMKTGQFTANDYAMLKDAAATIDRITISDMGRDLTTKGKSPASDVFSIGQEARDWVETQGGQKLILLDYLQLVSAAKNTKAGNREQVISETSRELKLLALTEKCPIIALSQLSREVEKRGDKRPMLSDLRESGAIEQDADNVLFLYRPSYYDIATLDDGSSTNGVGVVITAKQRSGTVGDVTLGFDGVRGWIDFDAPRQTQPLRVFSESASTPDNFPF